MTPLFSADLLSAWQARLQAATPVAAALAADRVPLHVVYGGAHRFRPDIAAKLGHLALAALDANAPTPDAFADALGLPAATAHVVYPRVRSKLATEPVEDYRIDFEDGYGARADDEEDRHATAVGEALVAGLEQDSLPRSIGIRIKALGPATAPRSLRTLALVLQNLKGTRPPAGFVVTLPKVDGPVAVQVIAEALTYAERAYGWPAGHIGIEIMVEDPRIWFDGEGRFGVPRLPEAADGRLAAVHLGPYDYTAMVGIAGDDQQLFHPVLDVARHLLQVALSNAGVRLGDGPTMLMPIAPHRGPVDQLTAQQRHENRQTVHRAWRQHANAVRESMRRGFDLGWDLHPAQIPARLGAVYAAYHARLPEVAQRLRNFVDAAGQATRVGAVFDDAATGQGLVNFCLRAIATGAVDEDEIVEATGLDRALLATRSFAEIVRATTSER